MFKPTFKKSFVVDGQDVDVIFKRMTRKHAIQASPMVDAGGEAVGIEKSLEFMNISAEILKDCIKSISGLKRETDQGVVEYTVDDPDFQEDVLGGAYFINFVSELISALMEESFLKVEDEKKSDQGLSEPTSAQASSTTTT